MSVTGALSAGVHGECIHLADRGGLTFDAVARTPEAMEWDWRAGERGEVQNPLDLRAKIPIFCGDRIRIRQCSLWLCSLVAAAASPEAGRDLMFFLHPAPSALSASARQHCMFCSKRKNNFLLLTHFFRYSGSSVKALHELMCRMCQSHCVASCDLWFHPFLLQPGILRCRRALQGRGALKAMSQCVWLAVCAVLWGLQSLVSPAASPRLLCYLLPIKQIKALLCHWHRREGFELSALPLTAFLVIRFEVSKCLYRNCHLHWGFTVLSNFQPDLRIAK